MRFLVWFPVYILWICFIGEQECPSFPFGRDGKRNLTIFTKEEGISCMCFSVRRTVGIKRWESICILSHNNAFATKSSQMEKCGFEEPLVKEFYIGMNP